MLIKDVDFKLITKFKETKNKIQELLKTSEMLGKYLDAPEEVLSSVLITLEDEEEKKRVNEILLGMRGEFTRSKALELGKSKMLSIIKILRDDIVTDYIDLYNLFKAPVETLSDNYNIITNTTNNKALELRRDQYMAKPLLVDYATRKLPSVVIPFINEAGSSKSVVEYLARLRDIFIIMTNYDVSDVKQMYVAYKNRKDYLEDLQKEYTKDSEKETIAIHLVDKVLDTNDYIKKLVDGETIVPEGKDSISILNDLISDAVKVLEHLKEDVNEITSVINYNKSETTITIPVMNKFIEDSVTPYINGEITKDDYIDKILIVRNVLDNSVNIDLDIVNDVTSKLHELNILLNVYMVVHGILDKISLYINIENSTMKVSGVAK